MVLEAPVGKSGVHQRVGIPNRNLKELIDKEALLLGERLVARREGVRVAFVPIEVIEYRIHWKVKVSTVSM